MRRLCIVLLASSVFIWAFRRNKLLAIFSYKKDPPFPLPHARDGSQREKHYSTSNLFPGFLADLRIIFFVDLLGTSSGTQITNKHEREVREGRPRTCDFSWRHIEPALCQLCLIDIAYSTRALRGTGIFFLLCRSRVRWFARC